MNAAVVLAAVTDRQVERFLAKCVEDPATGCVLWCGGTVGGGYGLFRVDSHRTIRAHRFAWQAFVGPIPVDEDGEPFVLDHLCAVRRCVNVAGLGAHPAHLEAVPHGENTTRSNVNRSCVGELAAVGF